MHLHMSSSGWMDLRIQCRKQHKSQQISNPNKLNNISNKCKKFSFNKAVRRKGRWDLVILVNHSNSKIPSLRMTTNSSKWSEINNNRRGGGWWTSLTDKIDFNQVISSKNLKWNQCWAKESNRLNNKMKR